MPCVDIGFKLEQYPRNATFHSQRIRGGFSPFVTCYLSLERRHLDIIVIDAFFGILTRGDVESTISWINATAVAQFREYRSYYNQVRIIRNPKFFIFDLRFTPLM
jgi:hypothetical protein